MTDTLYPPTSRELAEKRRTLAPETERHFRLSAARCSPTAP